MPDKAENSLSVPLFTAVRRRGIRLQALTFAFCPLIQVIYFRIR